MKPGRGFASPLVEVEVFGMPCDVAKNKTHQVGMYLRYWLFIMILVLYCILMLHDYCFFLSQTLTASIPFGSQNLNSTSTTPSVPSSGLWYRILTYLVILLTSDKPFYR